MPGAVTRKQKWDLRDQKFLSPKFKMKTKASQNCWLLQAKHRYETGGGVKNQTYPVLVPPSNLKQVSFYPVLEPKMEFFHHWKTVPVLVNEFGHTSIFLVPFPQKKGSEKLSDVPEITEQIKLRQPPSSCLVLKSLRCKHVIKQTEINRKRP